MDGVAPYERWEIAGVIKTRHCPRQLVTADSSMWVMLYSHYKAGHLAYAGGILEQPNRYAEAMRVVDQQVNQNNG